MGIKSAEYCTRIGMILVMLQYVHARAALLWRARQLILCACQSKGSPQDAAGQAWAPCWNVPERPPAAPSVRRRNTGQGPVGGQGHPSECIPEQVEHSEVETCIRQPADLQPGIGKEVPVVPVRALPLLVVFCPGRIPRKRRHGAFRPAAGSRKGCVRRRYRGGGARESAAALGCERSPGVQHIWDVLLPHQHHLLLVQAH